MEIYNLDLEQCLIAGILRHPTAFADVDSYTDQNDFFSPLHRRIFSVIEQTSRDNQKLDKVLVADKIERLSLSFDDKISSVLDYLEEISSKQINASSIKQIAKELKTVSLRRELAGTGEDIKDAMYKYPEASAEDLIKIADELYNKRVELWNVGGDEPVNIFEGLDQRLDELAANPIEIVGLPGPHQLINNMYGSLLRPGNITTVCSRSGSGKTTLMTDYCFKVSEETGIPVIHFDNGEMLKEELQMRTIAAISGIPLHYLETGKFGKDPEMIFKVKAAKKRVKDQKFFYYNVAGRNVEEMLSILRRFYLSRVGRKNKAIFCFDYIKSTSEASSLAKAEWESIGRMVTKFKDFISGEIQLPMLTAVQSNRTGIVTSKESKFIVDDESIFSGGDRTVFFSSLAFILRKKAVDEMASENDRFGTHKLINVKARHLGHDVARAINLVTTPDKRRRPNYINLDIKNFHVTEVGDLVSQVQQIGDLDISSNQHIYQLD